MREGTQNHHRTDYRKNLFRYTPAAHAPCRSPRKRRKVSQYRPLGRGRPLADFSGQIRLGGLPLTLPAGGKFDLFVLAYGRARLAQPAVVGLNGLRIIHRPAKTAALALTHCLVAAAESMSKGRYA
jgi:hypothetical protein